MLSQVGFMGCVHEAMTRWEPMRPVPDCGSGTAYVKTDVRIIPKKEEIAYDFKVCVAIGSVDIPFLAILQP
jgi:hypothetical protein